MTIKFWNSPVEGCSLFAATCNCISTKLICNTPQILIITKPEFCSTSYCIFSTIPHIYGAQWNSFFSKNILNSGPHSDLHADVNSDLHADVNFFQ